MIELNPIVWDNLFLRTDGFVFDLTTLEVLKYFYGLKHYTKNTFYIFNDKMYLKFLNDYSFLIKKEFTI